MPDIKPSICATFDRLASRVWHVIPDAYHRGLHYGEETITDEILLRLARRHPSEVWIKPSTKWEEGKLTGADWEWWIGQKKWWFRMRVQAKRIRQPAFTYPELLRKHPRGATRQINRLIRAAAASKQYPLYCFYNHVPDPPSHANGCGRKPLTHHFWGCTIADAYAVRELLWKGAKSFQDLYHIMLPWSCLVCCPNGNLLADKAFRVAQILREHANPKKVDAGLPEPVSDLPLYAKAARSPDARGSNDLHGWNEVPADVRRVLVLEGREH